MRRFNTTGPEETALQMARYRVRKQRKFYMHLFIYAIVVALTLAKQYIGGAFSFWPIRHINGLFMMIWTLIIVIQGIKLFFRENVFNADWEQRKMQQFLNNEKQNKYE